MPKLINKKYFYLHPFLFILLFQILDGFHYFILMAIELIPSILHMPEQPKVHLHQWDVT
jgi:hypothetical protein